MNYGSHPVIDQDLPNAQPHRLLTFHSQLQKLRYFQYFTTSRDL